MALSEINVLVLPIIMMSLAMVFAKDWTCLRFNTPRVTKKHSQEQEKLCCIVKYSWMMSLFLLLLYHWRWRHGVRVHNDGTARCLTRPPPQSPAAIMGTTMSEPCIYDKLSESIDILRQSGYRYGMSEREIERFIKQVLETNEPRREPPQFPILRATVKVRQEDSTSAGPLLTCQQLVFLT